MDQYYYHNAIREEAELTLKSVMRALTFRWRLILCIAAVPVLMAALAYWTIQPNFSATARILIDPRPRQLLENGVAQTGMGKSALGGDVMMLDSQARILDSRDLLTKVALEQGLDRMEIEGSSTWLNLLQILKWIERGPQSANLPKHSALELALKGLRSNLRIDRVGNTYVFDVTFASPDRIEAATVANAVVATYVQAENENFRKRIQEEINALDKIVATLRAESENANLQLVEFRSQSEKLDHANGRSNSSAFLREMKLNEIQARNELLRENLRVVSERAIQAKVEQGFPSDTVRLVSQAEPSTYPSGPKPSLLLVVITLLGLMVGSVVALVLHLLSGTPEAEEAEPRQKEAKAAWLSNLVKAEQPPMHMQPQPANANQDLPQQLFLQRHGITQRHQA